MRKFEPMLDGPLGGEAWQNPPRTMPWDRPPQFAEVDAGLDYIFKQLRFPGRAKQILNLAKSGVPVDFLAEQILMKGFGDGKFGAPALLQMVGPTIAMMWRMCESAGIRPMTTTDKEAGQVDFDPTELLMAQQAISDNSADRAVRGNTLSSRELNNPRIIEKQGFMGFAPKLKATKGKN